MRWLFEEKIRKFYSVPGIPVHIFMYSSYRNVILFELFGRIHICSGLCHVYYVFMYSSRWKIILFETFYENYKWREGPPTEIASCRMNVVYMYVCMDGWMDSRHNGIWYMEINNTKFRQRYFVNLRTNKHTSKIELS